MTNAECWEELTIRGWQYRMLPNGLHEIWAEYRSRSGKKRTTQCFVKDTAKHALEAGIMWESLQKKGGTR